MKYKLFPRRVFLAEAGRLITFARRREKGGGTEMLPRQVPSRSARGKVERKRGEGGEP